MYHIVRQEEVNRKSDRLYIGALEEISTEFGVSKRSVQRIVLDYKAQIESGVKVPNLENQKKKKNEAAAENSTLIPELLENIRRVKAKAKGNKMTIARLAEAYEQVGFSIPSVPP